MVREENAILSVAPSCLITVARVKRADGSVFLGFKMARFGRRRQDYCCVARIRFVSFERL